MIDQSIFRTYDIRGIYPEEINADVTRKIAQGFLAITRPRTMVIGRDVRLSSPKLHDAFVETALEAGVDVTDVGVVNTDRVYFAVGKYGFDLGVVVTASHNPPEWNGFKASRKGVEPIVTKDILAVKDFVLSGKTLPNAERRGKLEKLDTLKDYLDFVLSFVDTKALKPYKILINTNFGTMGEVAEALKDRVPFDLVPLNFKVDGSFPKGAPDPLLAQNRAETTEEARRNHVDFAVAWDSDGDRTFFHDENGELVRGAFMTAILSTLILARKPSGKIVSEPRVVWPVKEIVEAAGGQYIMHQTGYVLIREKMRQVRAVFGGENSAHYMFPETWYADNGVLPFLMIWEHLSRTGDKMSEAVVPFRAKYFVSEEINFPLETMEAAEPILARASERYKDGKQDRISGISVEYADWRFNLRPSDNEPLIRLQVETRSQGLLEAKTKELTALVKKLI